MRLKEFIKPTIWKIIVIVLILVIPIIPFKSALDVVGAGYEFISVGQMLIGGFIDVFESIGKATFINQLGTFILALLILLIVYIISCFIMWIIEKIKSRKQNIR